MDQSRPRHPTLNQPIIDRPDLQSLGHRTLSGMLTAFFWAMWIYLWLPLLALLAWLVGIQEAYKYMVVLGGYKEVLRLLGIYTAVALLLGGALVIWATYNIQRYGRMPMRAGSRIPSVEEVARWFRQGPNAVESWRESKRSYVVHDAEGNIARVDLLPAGTQVPGFQDAGVQA
jgi:biofilm PGA synthesis protein PgaD